MKWLVLGVCLTPILLGLLLLPAGRSDWPAAYLAVAIFLLGAIPQAAWLARHNPILFYRRGNATGGEHTPPSWDRRLVSLIKLSTLSIPLLGALDSGPTARWPSSLQLAVGLILFAAGLTLLTASQRANRFFEAYVRLQSELAHQPIRSGPYARLRHPGYLSYALMFAAGPLLLASSWAWAGWLATLMLLNLRLVWEEGYLRQHLAGYSEYCAQVRSRLIPGIW